MFISSCGQVFVGRVESLCPEKDCTDHVIKVVNPTTGECVTCFPCQDLCSVGAPSVRCGSTVPNGTQIHCVQPRPTPKLVSPSVILWSAASSINSVVVHASSSKNFVRSSSSTVYSDFTPENPRKKKEFPSDRPIKQGSNTSIYTFGVIFLIITLVLIAYKWRKIKSKQSHLLAVNRHTNSNQELSTIVSLERNSDTYTVNPETNSAACSQTRSKDEQKSNKGNDKHHFQADSGLVDSHVVNAADVPSSLDAANYEGDQVNGDPRSDDENLLDLLPNPDQPTETTNGFPFSNSGPSFITPSVNILLQTPSTFPQPQNPFISTPDSWQHLNIWSGIASDLDQQRPVKWTTLSQTERCNTKMKEVPFLLCHNIGLSLDIPRTDGQDVREFADKLGVTPEAFGRLQQAATIQKTTTTSVVIKEKFCGTVGDFIAIMKELGRDDIITLIDNWND